MIVRDEASHCLLITQPAHAWISAQIAEHWGGNGFLKPEPWKDVCFAAANHDAGWYSWDMNPALNQSTGLPCDFMNIPAEDHFIIWEAAPEKVGLVSRFAALLVSRHVMGLYRMNDFSKDKESIRQKARTFCNNQKYLQKRLFTSMQNDKSYNRFMNDDHLMKCQSLISVFDYFSLIMCMGNIIRETITNVPHQSGNVSLSVSADDKPNRYIVNPWPFTKKEITLHCDAGIMRGKFSDKSALNEGIRNAEKAVFKAALSSS